MSDHPAVELRKANDRLRGINEMYEHDNAELHNINGRLLAALEQLIKDFEAVAGSEATKARAALNEETK